MGIHYDPNKEVAIVRLEDTEITFDYINTIGNKIAELCKKCNKYEENEKYLNCECYRDFFLHFDRVKSWEDKYFENQFEIAECVRKELFYVLNVSKDILDNGCEKKRDK